MRKSLSILVAAAAFCLLMSPEAHAQKGVLFVNTSQFPTSASSVKEFIKIGRKNNKKKLNLSGNSVSFHILLVFKNYNAKRYKGKRIYFVLYQVGKKGYIDARDMAFPPSALFISPLSYSSDKLKRGKKYELRAVRAYKRGKKRIEKVIARRRFKLQ